MERQPKLNLPTLTVETATGPAQGIMKSTQGKMGFVPNMYGNMANISAVLENYMSSYTSFRSEAGFTPQEQETVFLTISRLNNCKYCSAAHSMVADKMSGVEPQDLEALRKGAALPTERLDALATFTEIMVEKRGNPSHEEVQAFFDAGFTAHNALGLTLAIAAKTFSNFSNHLFGSEIDEAFAPYAL